MCHLHDVSVVLSSQGVAVEMIAAEARCPDGAAVGVFSWSEWLRCHKWSWWCLWTSHSQHLPLVPAKHSAAPSNPHIQTLPTLGSSPPPRRIFQLSKDKKGPSPNQEMLHGRSLSSNIPRSSPRRDGLKLTPTTGASFIFIAAWVRVSLSSLPVCKVAHPLESAIQHLGRAARCQRRRLSVWRGADERQTGRVFEYNLCRGIYRINSLSSSEISSLYFLHLRSWPCIRRCSLDCWEFASSACCRHADNVCMHAPTRAGLMCIDGLYMSSRDEEEEKKKVVFIIIIVFIAVKPVLFQRY